MKYFLDKYRVELCMIVFGRYSIKLRVVFEIVICNVGIWMLKLSFLFLYSKIIVVKLIKKIGIFNRYWNVFRFCLFVIEDSVKFFSLLMFFIVFFVFVCW